MATAVERAEFRSGDQINGNVMLEHRYVRVGLQLVCQGILYRQACGIRNMDDTPMAMPALACEVIAGAGSIPGKRHALADKPVDGCLAPLHDETGRAWIAQTCAGNQGVLDVSLDRIGIVQWRGDTSLGAVAGAVFKRPLGDQGNLHVRCQLQRKRLTRQAATDDQDVENLHEGNE